MSARRRPPRDVVLGGLLALTVCVPAIAFLFGTREGEVVFTLYREPKLTAIQILGWALVVLLVWLGKDAITPRAALATLRQPFFLALAGFILYAAATGLWARVKENTFYELHQYLLLFVLLIALRAWASRDDRVVRVVLVSLVAAVVPVTAVGFAQLFVDIPFLRSIDPGYGVRHASFMGYKNPMALAILGHFYLLLYLIDERLRRGRTTFSTFALAGYALAEVLYLVSLQSRTAFVSLLASGAVLLAALIRATRRPARLSLAVAAVAAGLLVLALLLAPAARARLESLCGFARDPASFLQSDRGTYLLNTLNMARHNPFGVGLGDWQTHYPVYRRHHRDVAFTDQHQARRAHGDHVQLLGELGYPGLALWAAFLLTALAVPARRFLKTGDRLSLFLTVQLLAFVSAMATDYVLELPFAKLQLFLVCGVTAMACRPSAEPAPEARPGRGGPGSRVLGWSLVAAVTALGAVHVAYHGQLAVKSYASARLTVDYLDALDALAGADDPSAARAERRLASAELYGERFERLAGHHKTFYKDYLALAHVALLRGREPRAVALTRESLALHPFYPKSFQLLSLIYLDSDPGLAERYGEVYRYLMDEASEGFLIDYPEVGGTRFAAGPR